MNYIFLAKLVAGIVAIATLWGGGYFSGRSSRQGEIDTLQRVISDYNAVGKTIEKVGAQLQKDLEKRNSEILTTFSAEVSKTNEILDGASRRANEAAIDLKKSAESARGVQGKLVKAILDLPAGSPEQKRKVDELLAFLQDPNQTAAICSDTRVPAVLLRELRLAYSLDRK